MTQHTSTILIVDDEAMGREILAMLLAGQGYKLAFAANGAEALAKAVELTPDLILLDVMLPGMDGFEICQRLRADPHLAEVPVILVTALDDRDSRLRGIAAGADDFVTKPFDRAELRARVQTITRLNRYRRLLAERARFEQVFDRSPVGILIVDSHGAIQLTNPAMLRMLNADSADALVGTNMLALVAPEQVAYCSMLLDSVFARLLDITRIETMFVRRSGERFPVEVDIGPFVWNDQPAAQVIACDITERKRAELLEEERRQVAYELHDGVAQLVTSAHQHLQAFAANYRPRTPQARQDLGRVVELARRAVGEVRRVIAGLRPTALDDFGLATALLMHVEALRADGWEISYVETLGVERLPPTVETALFRVTQEALTNVRKHAHTARVRLALERRGPGIHLEVQDWGCGFQPFNPVGSAALGERVGLRGMQDRAMLLGGDCRIYSEPGAGTQVVVEIPLPAPNTGDISDEA